MSVIAADLEHDPETWTPVFGRDHAPARTPELGSDSIRTENAPVSAPASSWRDYLALLKPRVMSLVVFTAVTGLVAAGAPLHPVTAVVSILCIAVGAGAAGALNMAFDADIDALMRRTRSRPVASGRIEAGNAYGFGVALSLFSVLLMTMAANLLAAGLLAFTIVFYALVYTVWLKRSTPHNIVIGGAAGALPPVIGWAAASGEAPWQAWLLFALIFLWTPPHFWALSLYASEDYARAKVPMLPVIKGARATRRQIMIYSLVLAPVGVLPALTGLGGLAYAAVSLVGGAMFLLLAWRVFTSRAGDTDARGEGLYDPRVEARPARDLFAFSILYLFALFAALLAEKVWSLAA